MNSSLPSLENMKDILGVKGVMLWNDTWFKIVLYSILIIAILGLCFGLWRLWQRSQKIELSPLELARAALARIKLSRPTDTEGMRNFYFKISEVFRRFLTDEFKIAALEATFDELQKKIPAIPEFDSKLVSRVLFWLKLCEQVKFAAYLPNDEEFEFSIQECEKLLVELDNKKQETILKLSQAS